MTSLEATYDSSDPGGSRVVGFRSLRRTLSLLVRRAPAQGVAGVAGVLARSWCRRQRVSGHVVFLGGHDATHQDESLVVHVMIPFRSGVGYGQRRRRDRSVNQLEVGTGLRTAALRYQATVPLSWAVIIQASTKP